MKEFIEQAIEKYLAIVRRKKKPTKVREKGSSKRERRGLPLKLYTFKNLGKDVYYRPKFVTDFVFGLMLCSIQTGHEGNKK